MVESAEEGRLLAEQHHAEGGMGSAPEVPTCVDGRNQHHHHHHPHHHVEDDTGLLVQERASHLGPLESLESISQMFEMT